MLLLQQQLSLLRESLCVFEYFSNALGLHDGLLLVVSGRNDSLAVASAVLAVHFDPLLALRNILVMLIIVFVRILFLTSAGLELLPGALSLERQPVEVGVALGLLVVLAIFFVVLLLFMILGSLPSVVVFVCDGDVDLQVALGHASVSHGGRVPRLLLLIGDALPVLEAEGVLLLAALGIGIFLFLGSLVRLTLQVFIL